LPDQLSDQSSDQPSYVDTRPSGTAGPRPAPAGPGGARSATPDGPPTGYVDPRGPRFSAAVTSVVLAAVLLTGSGWLLAAQAVVFAVGAADLARSPYGLLFRRLVRPRLAAPTELEASASPRFAQLVGLTFAVVGAAGYLGGAAWLGLAATAAALAAAFANAAFGLCLGCELHLLLARAAHRPGGPRFVPAQPRQGRQTPLTRRTP